MAKREGFSSRIGFILSCIGSAIGLGNVWMFPYIIFVFALGSMGLIGEMAFGRMYKQGSLGAIRTVMNEKNKKGGKIFSVIPTIGLLGIFMFYTIVIGWI